MSTRLSRVVIAGMALVLALGFVPVVALANEGEGREDEVMYTTQAEDKSDRGAVLKQKLEAFREKRKQNRQLRLTQAKERICEQRKAKIKTIMNRAITRAERQLKLFSTIAERVKTFYVDKGYQLDNYDELVAAVDAAKAEAEANLSTLKNLEAFDCSADDPKGNAEVFKLAMQSVRQNLKDYRTTIKDLIVGVKSVHRAANAEEGGQE